MYVLMGGDHLRGAVGAPHVESVDFGGGQSVVDGIADQLGVRRLAKMAQHVDRSVQHGDRISNISSYRMIQTSAA
jgi:hypothetical protein